jgi:hypothetical protein
VTSDGRFIISAHFDGQVRWWPLVPPSQTAVATNLHWPHVLSPDGRWLAAMRWETASGSQQARIAGVALADLTGGATRLLVIDPDALPLGFSADSGMVFLVRRVTKGLFRLEHHPVTGGPPRWQRDFAVTHDQPPPAPGLRFDADGHRVFVEAASPGRPAPGRSAVAAGRVDRPPEAMRDPPVFWRCSHDGRWLGFANTGGVITVWNTLDGRVRARLPPADYLAPWWGFAPGGRWLVRSRSEGKRFVLECWDLETGRLRWESEGRGPLKDLAFAPDESWVAVFWSGSDAIRFLDCVDGTPRRSPNFLSNPGDKLAVSPDGRTLAAGGQYGVVHLYSTRTGRELIAVSKAEDLENASEYAGVRPDVARWPRTIAFSGDGSTLISADWGGWVRVWRAPSIETIEARR